MAQVLEVVKDMRRRVLNVEDSKSQLAGPLEKLNLEVSMTSIRQELL